MAAHSQIRGLGQGDWVFQIEDLLRSWPEMKWTPNRKEVLRKSSLWFQGKPEAASSCFSQSLAPRKAHFGEAERFSIHSVSSWTPWAPDFFRKKRPFKDRQIGSFKLRMLRRWPSAWRLWRIHVVLWSFFFWELGGRSLWL